jgi:myosin heavy subunit
VDEELLQHILESSPIFEAFGNAKTFHNDNSSRFGKVTQLQYVVSPSGGAHLVGTAFETYMLETGRVVKHANGDRNYHIFYQILSNPKEVKRVLLGPDWMHAVPDDFRYLNQFSNSEFKGMNDLKMWKETAKALNHFGWTENSLKLLVRGLGVVLLLGNIVFDEKEEGEAIISNRGDLNLLALSLEVSVEKLEFSLTQRVIETTQELLSVPHSAYQAKDACDALAKAIYAGIFASVVRQINVLTSAPPAVTGKHHAISLVDIFGFESFQINRFEQLVSFFMFFFRL